MLRKLGSFTVRQFCPTEFLRHFSAKVLNDFDDVDREKNVKILSLEIDVSEKK